jgi:2,5-diketo-D-gluconate reductase A
VTSIPDITLNNGQTIPQFGFGVFQIEPKDTVAAVSTALEAGYRHIDTAEMYGNEAEVGEAIARSGLDRGEVVVTSKLSNDAHEPDEARQAFEETLKALGTDYVDLFLIHWPLPTRYGGDFVQTWRTLEEFYREGRPGPSACPTSSHITCGACTVRPRSSRPSTRSRCTRT